MALWRLGQSLHAAGFDPNSTRLRTRWDREKVINGIQRMQGRRLPLYAKYVMKHSKSLFCAALRQFGSWDEAPVAAGVYFMPNKKNVTE
jgi:hypothetical protein